MISKRVVFSVDPHFVNKHQQKERETMSKINQFNAEGKIDKLTPEQEAKIPEYLDRFLKIGLSTEPCNRAEAEAAIAESYKFMNLKPPSRFIWCDSPFEGVKIAAQLAHDREEVTKEEISDQISKASFGSLAAYWVGFYSFVANELPVKHDNLINVVERIIKNTGVYWTFEDAVVISEKPKTIHLKDEKLHNTEGMALEYRDGTGVYSVDGVRQRSLLDLAINAAEKN